ncbi:GNAT family N-acetyltransferase [Streptomyces sp. CC228A]|uniref:GNAT family N-acetyltransferase n=1 Tax=Streptomyces sp. CC228A TaxID=2898186 RepID=UPI001F21840E|nr:GNAT family N-acetyltransferase [Streptomyces sp. CC228A]
MTGPAGWELAYGTEAFHREAGTHLRAEAARCTVLLTTAETLRLHGPGAYGGAAPVFGWWRAAAGGPVEGAFVHAPPFPPALGPMPRRAARELAAALRPTGTDLPGVQGTESSAVPFALAWAGGGWTATRRLRLLALAEPAAPHPAPPGSDRPATPADVPLVAAWLRGFTTDTGLPRSTDADLTAQARRRIADGALHLWEDGGRPVAMAARSATVAGQARIGPVYTPPRDRGRGYGGAVTSAAARAAQSAGARRVLLFADAANPTSNDLYARLGYRLLDHHTDIDFT